MKKKGLLLLVHDATPRHSGATAAASSGHQLWKKSRRHDVSKDKCYLH